MVLTDADVGSVLEQGFHLELKGRMMVRGGVEQVCSSISFWQGGAEFFSRSKLAVGDEAVFYMDRLGNFPAIVESVRSGTFRVAFTGTQARLDKLAARLSWLARKANSGATENRGADRIVPRRQEVRLVMGDNQWNAWVADVSQTGANIVVQDFVPIAGDKVTLGLRRAEVVRHTDEGFAVRFVMPLPVNTFDENIVL